MPQNFSDAGAVADAIIVRAGKRIVLGLPLGLGKANHIVNALFARAAADPTIHLTIFTALTLEKPRPKNELEARFINPVIDRLFGGYPDLAYAQALHQGRMPPNVEVNEFFFLAGLWLGSPTAQQNYIAANYTHALQYLLAKGVNVVAQLVAKRVVEGKARYSLGGNTDITTDLLKARQAGRAAFQMYGEVNSEMPFMPGDGDLAADDFAGVLDSPATDFPLFAPPSEPITDRKYAIGLHAARLVRDGGTLQIGIGQVGDALAQSLIVRDRNNDTFRELVAKLANGAASLPGEDLGTFEAGLYGVSEMFFEAFLALIDAKIVRREVDGALLHAAFFLGPKAFYRRLREMPPEQLNRIQMKAVSFTNEIYDEEAAKRAARRDARFVNNAMMATLLGGVVSDGLEDGRVVSGVGGQYNFVAQAFALEGARSILTLEASRKAAGRDESNVRWSYGHLTIPRHLRDVVVTEYGIADLRGKPDHDVIAAMLAIADSRFQDELMRRAKDAGKLAKSFELPASARDNFPERIGRILKPYRERRLLPAFPFGSDFTEVEQQLIPALETLKDASASLPEVAGLAIAGLGADKMKLAPALARLSLEKPASWSDRLYRLLVSGALRRAG
jgi:Acetyl-CoA hydrolase/transferase C-terminal domain